MLVIFILSIVVPTFNRAKSLKAALDSLLQQNYSDFEVIVVDNGPSTDKTKIIVETIAKKDKRVKYISTELKGCIFARNIGAKNAKGEIMLTLDDDIEFIEPETLKVLMETFTVDSKIGIVGSIELRKANQIVPRGPDPLPSETGRIFLDGEVNTAFGWIEGHGITEVDHVRSAFMAIRMELFKLVGAFDETYDAKGLGFRYETDICLKIKEIGYKVIVNPKIKIWHKVAKRSRGFQRNKGIYYFYYANRNHIFFMRRFFWKKHSFTKLIKDILRGTRSCPGIKRGLANLKHELNFIWTVYVIASIIGKISGYLRYLKYGS
jgi:glycosyltransferase involved in cell wall biosynthesis